MGHPVSKENFRCCSKKFLSIMIRASVPAALQNFGKHQIKKITGVFLEKKLKMHYSTNIISLNITASDAKIVNITLNLCQFELKCFQYN